MYPFQRLSIGALLFAFSVFGSSSWAESYPRPSDWKTHSIALVDSRPGRFQDKAHIEVIELPSAAATTGSILMIPGFFQNAWTFDLLPEAQVSFGRWVSRTFGLKVYLLNVRGVGYSSRGKKLNIDDFVIDDIPTAIQWVSDREKSPIYVLGHSQGGIVLQASVSGLTRCGARNCFDSLVAEKRQSMIQALAISAGSVSMATREAGNRLPLLGNLGKILSRPINSAMDYISVDHLVNTPILRPFAHAGFFEFLYHRKNTTAKQRRALYERTLEASYAQIVLQFADGVRNQNIRVLGNLPDSNGELYRDGLKNIRVPLVQVTYGVDPMAEPVPTFDTSFHYVGSFRKRFYIVDDQGHEDYLMVPERHSKWEAPFKWLMSVK